MERLEISQQTQQTMDDFRSTYAQFDPNGLIYPGSNLVVDDHLQIDNSWSGVVLGGEGTAVWFCVPAWGDLILPIDLIDYITDRAGPNGETMPVFDPVQAEARASAKTQAVSDTTHGQHRSLKDAVHDAVKRLSHSEEKRAREVLKKHGVL